MKKKLMFGSGIVILVVAFFVFSSPATEAIPSDEVKEFNIEAFQFGYSPNVIRVAKGDNVRLVIDNLDTSHGIRIPEFGVGGVDSVEFVADKKGEFTWYCKIPCGSGHMTMEGTIIVE